MTCRSFPGWFYVAKNDTVTQKASTKAFSPGTSAIESLNL